MNLTSQLLPSDGDVQSGTVLWQGPVVHNEESQVEPVMLSLRGRSGLKAKILALASKLWPRPGLDLVVLLSNRAFFMQKLRKIWEFC